jgi:hypothetical protein
MGFRSVLKDILRGILRKYGFDIVPKVSVYDWQVKAPSRTRDQGYLPEDARSYLTPHNQRLLDYQERYRNSSYPISEVALWTEDHVSPEDILYFRGHNPYVFQEGRFNRNIFGYLLAYYYIKTIDNQQLLSRLREDNAFGAITYPIDGKQVSRDLLDSILEIYFLDNHLHLGEKSSFNVLDIGAGYGRLAHRMAKAFPNINHFYCADAIAVSSFLAEYYLTFRGIEDVAQILPLDTIRKELADTSIDVALNIHSFSECTLPAIEWWFSLLEENRVPYLMIVPNSGEKLLAYDKNDFRPLIEKYGYELMVMEPKYKDPLVQKYGLHPDYFHLFKRR